MTTQTSRLVIEIDSRNALRNAQAISKELDNIDKNGEFASKSMDSMSVATRQLAGQMVGLLTVGAAVAKMDAYTGIQNQLKLVTTEQDQLNRAMEETFGIAQRSRSSWESVTTVYQKLAMNAKEIGLAQPDIARLTETVSKGIALSGASAEGAASAITQLGQALGNGQLRGDEFNAVMENGYGLMRLLAQGMGVPIGKLKAMAEAGELTSEKVTQALLKMSSAADTEFSKTDATIKQSMTMLSNSVTEFTGEAGKASGAAVLLSGGIQGLANNLGALSNVTMLGGVAYLTKTIIAQTVAIRRSISATLERRAADTAALQSQAQLAAIEVQRIRQVAALALTEINLARQELNSATTRQERAAATMRLTQAEIALAIAQKQTKVATVEQIAAENALNASRAIGSRMLALVGGPIGAITIGVAALTAGYMYFSNRAAEANAKLEEQGKVAEKTKEELLALKGVQLDVAKDDLAASFEDQNDKLNKLNLSFNGFIRTVKNANEGNKEVREISDQVHKGLMSQADAIERLNKLKLLTPEQKSQGLDLIKSYEEARVKAQQNADAQKTLGERVVLAGNSASNAVGKVNDNSNAMHKNAAAANAAAEAQSKYILNLQKSAAQTIMTNKLIAKDWDIERAKAASQAAFENGGKVSAKDIQIIDMNIAANKKLQASEEAITNAQKASSKASKDALSQQKKDAKEADRLKEEQYDLRERIAYDYKDRILKIEKDLENEIADIQKANFSPKDTAGYIQNAKNRADLEKQLYVAQLAEDVSAWRLSEERKLELKKTVNDLIIQLNGDMNDAFKKQALQSSEDQYLHELGLIKLAKEQRIFQAEQAMMTEVQVMQERYRLEREEIAKTANISDDEKVRRLSASQFNQKQEETNLTKSLTQEYMGAMGFEENPLIQQFEVLQKARENDLINEEEYQNAKLQLQAKSTASYMEGMFGGFAELVDENSKTYAVLFAAQKAFAVAQAMLNIPAAYSKAYDAVVGTPYIGPYIAPAMGAAAAALQVVQAASIKNVSMSGFATGGFTGTGGKFDPAGIVHKGEVVWSQEDIKRWGGVNVVEAMRTSQPPKGYSEGGLVTPKDTYRVGMGTVDAINRGADVQAERQAQANVRADAGASANVNLNPNFVIVDERESLSDYLFSPDGTKAFVKFFKRNRSALGV